MVTFILLLMDGEWLGFVGPSPWFNECVHTAMIARTSNNWRRSMSPEAVEKLPNTSWSGLISVTDLSRPQIAGRAATADRPIAHDVITKRVDAREGSPLCARS